MNRIVELFLILPSLVVVGVMSCRIRGQLDHGGLFLGLTRG